MFFKKALYRTLAVVLAAAFCQNCLSIVGKKTQGVTVTARPAGARVFVDGKFEGVTPLGLRLAKKPPHIIRIEKEGYRPVEIRLKKSKNWFAVVFPNLIWAPLSLAPMILLLQGTDENFLFTALTVAFFAAPPAAMYIDALSAKSSLLEPRHLLVTLEKGEGRGEPIVINLDAADFRNIYWISVLGDHTAVRR